MDKPVGEHIRVLEEKRKELATEIMNTITNGKLNKLETRLSAVESALALYRSALETEKRALADSD
ncbi:MAG TPA: hypothetical protein VFA85_08560 [Terriglobales bacterium]|nr:hypothetical protein [Terriglobales bacterium]